jgi:hypothetical protein
MDLLQKEFNMSIKSGIQTFKASVAIITLAIGLVACPPPPPVVQGYSADLINQNGTNVTGRANATLVTTTIEISGTIFNANPADKFVSTITCKQTRNLTAGTDNGNPTFYGTFADGTAEDKTALESNACVISVRNVSGVLVLKGNLKR